ncbi:MAG: glycosyltransferase family 4 protein [Elusimicrobia bacterium]|nr:glycosyltransferase family 4 protein [Elusimicrobiota bacterium]
MRIALEVSGLLDAASGLGFYIERLSAALVAAAPEHEFVFTSASWSGADRLTAAPLPRARNASLLHLRAPQRLLLPAEEFAGSRWRERRLLAAGIELFHGMGNALPPLATLPGVVTMHHIGGSVPPSLWNGFFFGTLPRRSALRADRVIAVSGPTRDALIADWGVDPGKVVVVHEGGPGPEFRPAPARPAETPYVLHVGALVARKNVANLLRAFGKVVERDPSRPLRLVLAGRDGDATSEATRLASAPPLAGRVEFLGPVTRERLIGLYQGAVLVAVPSLLEGFGFPLLEAMACGAPVVAADAASLPELAGDAAVLCDATRPEPLADALARVLDDRGLADALRAKGPARAARFTWDSAARATLTVINEARAAKR